MKQKLKNVFFVEMEEHEGGTRIYYFKGHAQKMDLFNPPFFSHSVLSICLSLFFLCLCIRYICLSLYPFSHSLLFKSYLLFLSLSLSVSLLFYSFTLFLSLFLIVVCVGERALINGQTNFLISFYCHRRG